jgi:hypothetical protein
MRRRKGAVRHQRDRGFEDDRTVKDSHQRASSRCILRRARMEGNDVCHTSIVASGAHAHPALKHNDG